MLWYLEMCWPCIYEGVDCYVRQMHVVMNKIAGCDVRRDKKMRRCKNMIHEGMVMMIMMMCMDECITISDQAMENQRVQHDGCKIKPRKKRNDGSWSQQMEPISEYLEHVHRWLERRGFGGRL